MKKFLWILGIISMLVLANCGGGDNSQKAKELLSRILNIVGIPYDIIVNICQDDNDNGICESSELQAKLTINKGDSVDDIWKKIAISDDGKYLLEHHDPTKKIIMEIRDTQNVTHNNGEFALSYNPMTTELSILQYMIDTGHLTTDDVNAVREMDNVDEFYKVLLKDFETNLNILQDKGLSPDRAVLANSKEIAEELISNGIVEELPKKINGCDGNQSCVDEELENLSKELVVDENETETIKQEQTQVTKKLLAGKTFYSYYIGNDDKKHITEVKVNNNATSWSYKDIIGGESSGTKTIEVDIDKLTIYYDDNTIEVETVIEREKYLAIGNMKFFYNRDDAQAFYNADTSSVDVNTTSDNELKDLKFTKEYLKGRTLYYVVYDDFGYDDIGEKWNMARWTFDENTLTHTEYNTPDTTTHTFNYSITSEGYLNIEDDILKAISNNSDYIGLDNGYLFFDEKKALEFRDKKRDENKKGFTKEMVLNKVVYGSSTDDDGSKVYSKATFESETSFLHKEVTVSTEGEVISNETFSLSYIIENGKLKIDTGESYIYLTLNSQDNTAWYVTEENDIGKDGTIDESEDYTSYLSKPSDYPAEL